MLTFRLTLTASIMLMIGALAGLLGYVQNRALDVAAETAARATMDAASTQAAVAIKLQFSSISRTLRLVAMSPSVADASVRNVADRGAVLMKGTLDDHPDIDSFYVGYDDGIWLQVQRLKGLDEEQFKRAQAPGAAEFATTMTDPSLAENNQTQRLFEDKEGNQTIRRSSFKRGYDPRQRDWYLSAQATQALVISSPYVSYGLGVPMLTLSAPLQGRARGVAGADLKLDTFSAYADAQKIGANGHIVAFDSEFNIIAHRDYSGLYRRAMENPEAAHLPSIADLDGSLAAKAMGAWDNSDSYQGELRWSDGEDYYFRIERVGLGLAFNATLLVISAKRDFAQEIKALNSKTKIIAALVGVIFVPLAWLFGSSMSRKLREITDQAVRLKTMLPPPSASIKSFVREIDTLGATVHQAQRAVWSFSRLVPKELVRGVLDSTISSELGGQRQEITVLFTDVRGFTALSENADPAVVMDQTSRYFSALAEAIIARGGTIDKFIGDAIMAFWNAPLPQIDHCERACDAAIQARAANERINREFVREGLPPFQTRYGIHVGDAIVGYVGSTERMNYTALGAVVNLAARLEGMNKDYGTEILVTEAVYLRVKHRFQCEYVDTVIARGMTGETRVYQLLQYHRDRGG
jgi:adenylate cyclase